MASTLRMSMQDSDGFTRKYTLPFEGGVFRISTLRWPNKYVYMQSNAIGNVRGWDGLPGPQGELIFTPLVSSYDSPYLISTKRWPDWYMYNDNGNVQGRQGNPGPRGHWRITVRDDGSVTLSTMQENVFMYMGDDDEANVKGVSETPGPQGSFILSCDLKLYQS